MSTITHKRLFRISLHRHYSTTGGAQFTRSSFYLTNFLCYFSLLFRVTCGLVGPVAYVSMINEEEEEEEEDEEEDEEQEEVNSLTCFGLIYWPSSGSLL